MTTRSRAPKIKKTKHLNLRDRLSRLNYLTACKLLGPEGDKLIQQGSKYDIDVQRRLPPRRSVPSQVRRHRPARAVASITKMAGATNRLKFNCTACETMCHHVGAAVSLVLEDKTGLGLAIPPDEKRPAGTAQRGRAYRTCPPRAAKAGERREVPRHVAGFPQALDRLHRRQRAFRQDLSRRPAGRGAGAVVLFMSRLPHQHAGHLQAHPAPAGQACGGDFPRPSGSKPYRNRETFVHVLYGEEMTLHLRLPDKPDEELVKLAGRLTEGPIDNARKLVEFLGQMERLGPRRDGLSRRRGAYPAAALPGTDVEADGRDPRQGGRASLADASC